MIGVSLSPLAFTKRAQISPSSDFSPPVQLRDASVWHSSKKLPCFVHVPYILWCPSLQDIRQSLLPRLPVCHSLRPQPQSPEINFAFIPFLVLKLFSQPLDALKSSACTSKALAICIAFSCGMHGTSNGNVFASGLS